MNDKMSRRQIDLDDETYGVVLLAPMIELPNPRAGVVVDGAA